MDLLSGTGLENIRRYAIALHFPGQQPHRKCVRPEKMPGWSRFELDRPPGLSDGNVSRPTQCFPGKRLTPQIHVCVCVRVRMCERLGDLLPRLGDELRLPLLIILLHTRELAPQPRLVLLHIFLDVVAVWVGKFAMMRA